MRLSSKPSALAEFERGRRVGLEGECALTARKLHQVRECLTAASFAIELAKTPGARQTKLLSTASNLLTKAMKLLQEDLDGKKDENLKKRVTQL